MPKTETQPEETMEVSESGDTMRYELMAILTPDMTASQYKKEVEELKAFLESHGASIWNEEDWGKRELAYSIKRQEYGYYVVFNFDAESTELPKINEQLRINNKVLRYLLIKVPIDFTPQTYDWSEEKAEHAVLETEKEQPIKRTAFKKKAREEIIKVAPVSEEEHEIEVMAEEAAAEEATAKEIEIVAEHAESASAKKAASAEEILTKKEKEVAEEPEQKAAEAPAKKREVAQKAESKTEESLSKLDEKLAELLSGDDDLNL